MVVVTAVRGSGPREAGTRMIVADGDLHWGTIGGGNLERQAIEHALALIEAGSTSGEACSESVAYPLSEKVGQCCGGEVTLFYEAFPWSRRRLVVFGAGHVGQAIGGLADYLACDVTLIDGRDEAALRPVPAAPAERAFELVCIDEPQGEVERLAPGTFVLIMTHSHALDLELVAAALRRGDELPYVGLIGSDRKWERFQKRLTARGFSAGEIARVRCPIGVTKGAKDPAAIAISTAAELVDLLRASDAGGAGQASTQASRESA